MVPSGGGDLEGAPTLLLAVHFGQVVLGVLYLHRSAGTFGPVGLNGFDPEEVIDHRLEVCARHHDQSIDQRRFCRVGRRYEDALEAERAEATSGDENPVDVRDRAIERELAQESRSRWRLLASARERDGDRDRKIEAAAFLTQLGRREVDRQAPAWKLQPAVLDRRAHALPSLFDRRAASPTRKNF